MKFGLHSVNLHSCSYPDAAARVGRAAEAAGFESLWVADHVVLPDPPVPGRPMAPDQRLLDPIVALTFLAAHTTRIRLATGVIILPQRQALVLAKQLASLDVLSNGRLIFGLGVGWCEPEMRSVGAPFAERGRVADDYLAAMRAVWSQPKPSYRGPYVSFDGVQAMPRPVQTPTPEIVVGGRTTPAFRRAVTQGHGWYGFGLDVSETQKLMDGLREAGKKHSRPARPRPARDQRDPARLRRSGQGDARCLCRRGRGPTHPATAARHGRRRARALRPRNRPRCRPEGGLRP